MFNNFFSEIHAVYEVMWKNVVKPEVTDDNIIQRLRVACWVNEATDTYSEHVILLFFHGNSGIANAHEFYVIRTLPLVNNGFSNYETRLSGC